jgi:hypothetical protein
MVSFTIPGGMRPQRGGARAARLVVCAGACLWLTSCAETQTVRPVSMSQQGDEALSCAQLGDQLHKNQLAAVQFAKQAKAVESDNDTYKVASIFVSLAAMGVDLSKEDQIKARSLQDRNEYLLYLRAEKKC